jgi:hypothetical protein
MKGNQINIIATNIWVIALFTLVNFSNAQTLPANQNSKISGPDVVCAESKEEYKFKHPTKDCHCEDITWTVSGGTFDTPPSTNPVFNEKIKIKWDKGVSDGSVSLQARKCFVGYTNGSPNINNDLDRNESYLVHIYDVGMVNLFVSGQSSVNCNSSLITLNLHSLNTHLNPNQIADIQWTVPSQWTIQPPQQTGGLQYGANRPNVNINTNGYAIGQLSVSVSYSNTLLSSLGTHHCSPFKSYNRSVTFAFEGCKPVISYYAPPSFYQSHSSVSTNFAFSNPAALANGYQYTFVAGEDINLENNFEIIADEETTFEAFVAACSCTSPWHDPKQKGHTTISIDGNFSNKTNREGSFNFEIDESTATNSFGTNENNIKVYVFPNPSNGELTINAPALFGLQTIWIYYADGRIVEEISHNFERNEGLELDLTRLPKGLFYLLMRNAIGESTHHSKFILQ